jgi:hypothetical protein
MTKDSAKHLPNLSSLHIRLSTMLGYKKNIPNVLRNVLVIVYFTPLSNMCRPQQRRSTQISATKGLAEILAQIYSMAIINRYL